MPRAHEASVALKKGLDSSCKIQWEREIERKRQTEEGREGEREQERSING